MFKNGKEEESPAQVLVFERALVREVWLGRLCKLFLLSSLSRAPQQFSEAPSTTAARSISSVSVCGLQVMLAKWSVCARTENDRPCLCGEREEGRGGERGGRREGGQRRAQSGGCNEQSHCTLPCLHSLLWEWDRRLPPPPPCPLSIAFLRGET